jgi:hypothetical protein
MSSGEISLKMHFADAFRQITKRSESPEIHVTFYPFAGLNHTIRIRRQRVYVRVSDILRDAPQPVCRALAFILVSKLFNKKAMAEHERLYRQYAYQPQVLRASDLARQKRGRKVLTGAVGRAYNLDKIFARLNRRYFGNELPKPALSWSARRTKRILGHHHQSLARQRKHARVSGRICALSRNVAHETPTARHQRAEGLSHRGLSRGRASLRTLRRCDGRIGADGEQKMI